MDPYTSAALVTGGAQIAGGFLQNEMNMSNASSANEWQGDQIRSGRAFEERMSNTAHQRQVSDLKAAGLNPILSANGGASSPSASGGTPAVAHAENIISPAISAAMEVQRVKNEIGLQKAQINKMNAEVGNINVQNELLRAQTNEAKTKSTIWGGGLKGIQKVKEFNVDSANEVNRVRDRDEQFQKIIEGNNSKAKQIHLDQIYEQKMKENNERLSIKGRGRP